MEIRTQTLLQVGLGPSSEEHAMAELGLVRHKSALTHSGSLLLQGQKGLFFPAGGPRAFPPVNFISQPGRKSVPGDLLSGAVSPELDRTSGTQLTGEGKTTWTGLCSVGEL